jgi:2-dehydro-3-deoxyphosphooctonate aldolase (KDO 8-P synthase)
MYALDATSRQSAPRHSKSLASCCTGLDLSTTESFMIPVGSFSIGAPGPLVLIAGPCVVESRELVLRTADEVKKVGQKYSIPVVFKSSYKKANRTSGTSFAGIGIDAALRILDDVKREFALPILTDIHTEQEAAIAADVADIIQIPAFLCRQTGLLQAAGRTGKVVNIKKGQFLAPGDMLHAVAKVKETGNTAILLTERGTTFGYHDLVVDMRSLAIMRGLGYPVVFDATHSVQQPGGSDSQTGGTPEFIFPLARAAAAVGIDGLFVEVHPEPAKALSDAASQLKLDLLDALVAQIGPIDRTVKNFS